MYKFVDTNEVSESALLPSEALQINGEFIENLIPGYRTLSVSGREALSPELSTYETGVRDGSTLKSKRYPARTIVIKYQLIAKSCEAFREAYNKLASVLDVEDAELIFNDETDKYFTGTPCAIGEVEPGRNAVSGEFEILCTDPFKYSVKEYEVKTTKDTEAGTVFLVDYNGTYKAFPTLEASFYSESETSEDGETEVELTGNGDCGFVAFFNENEKIIQLGDPEEVDGEELPKAQTLVNQYFDKSTSWGTAAKKMCAVNAGITSSNAVVQTGNVGLGIPNPSDKNSYYLTCVNYGSGAKWHGASITRKIPADSSGHVGASNFWFRYSQKMHIGNGKNDAKQLGAFQVLLVSGSGESRKIVAGVNVYKGGTGKVANLRFYVNNAVKETIQIDLSYYNKYFGSARLANAKKKITAITPSKVSVIQKDGGTITFNIGGLKKVFRDSEITDTEVTEITFTFTQWGNKPTLSYNGIYGFIFKKNNCDTWKDTPNKFGSNDVVTAECRTGEVFLNNLPVPEYGALGNDWEDFCLQPGINQIGVTYSDWVEDGFAPTFKMRYREVFL